LHFYKNACILPVEGEGEQARQTLELAAEPSAWRKWTAAFNLVLEAV